MTGENHESGITNHGGASRWLVWLGAFLFLSALPLQHLYLKLWADGGGLMAPVVEYSGYIVHTTWYRINWLGFLIGAVLNAALVAPSLAASARAVGHRFHRFLLVAFLPLSAVLSLVAADLAPPNLLFERSPIRVPTWLAVTPPLASAAGLLLAYVVGCPAAVLGPVARRLLAGLLLWLVLLQWSSLGLSVRYFPGWVGAGGAAMILLGELLAPRRDS